MKGSYNNKPHSDRNGRGCTFRQSHQIKERVEKVGNGRLTKPAQSKGCYGNSQLTSLKISVNIFGHFDCGFRSAAAFLGGNLKLGLTHTNQCEFRNNEEGIH